MTTQVTGIFNSVRDTLADGQFHSRNELQTLSGCKNVSALWVIISTLRRRLPNDQDIICELINRTVGYRHVKLIGKKQWAKCAKPKA